MKKILFLSHLQFLSIIFCVIALLVTTFLFQNNLLVIYGDAESHLNISKRVTGSITPGLAQLGGIWLPLPHMMMVPFTYFDYLWVTGLAGSIVSGFFYIVSARYLYKLSYLVIQNRITSFLITLFYGLNPNILYLQSTAMTEIPLIAFFILSTYFFVRHIKNTDNTLDLVYAAFYSFCATLSRYDGWFLVLIQCFLLVLYYGNRFWIELRNPDSTSPQRRLVTLWHRLEGNFLIFGTLAFMGIIGWLLWCWIILNDPLYFTNSPFSAKSQQRGWLGRGELPAYHDLPSSFLYYSITSYESIGQIITLIALLGFALFLFDSRIRERVYVVFLLLVPFFFYIVTLYLGQSVIFLPSLTPQNFEWNLFNVRYGVMMIPAAAFFAGYLSDVFLSSYLVTKRSFYGLIQFGIISIFLIALGVQTSRFLLGPETVLSFDDGKYGLSSAKTPNAEFWVRDNYDGGIVLMDDYARTLSVIRSGIPMQNVIYIGNKPYWEESLVNPEKHVRWIVMQENDAVWSAFLNDPAKEGHLYKYYERTYTSPQVLIFKRNAVPIASLQ